MNTIAIKKPIKGQRVKFKEELFTGRVIGVIDYEKATQGMFINERVHFNNNLMAQLGEDFRNLYFECYLRVLTQRKNCEYKKGEVVILNWNEYQKGEILPS